MKLKYILSAALLWGTIASQARENAFADDLLRRGIACLEGTSGAVDHQEAWDLLNKASEAGSVNARYHIAQMYKYGMYVGEDQTMYMAYLRDAASHDDLDAIAELGVLNLYGSRSALVPKNEREGMRLLQNAADKGHPLAYLYLGYVNERGMGGVKADNDKAYLLYSRAASAGNVQGLVEKARCMAFGKGTVSDASGAIKLLDQASRLGNAEALCIMGDMYQQGRGVTANDTTAFDCYMRSSSAGYDKAYVNLAMAYVNGRGVPADEFRAFHYFKKAADADVPEGYTGLGMCHEYGINAPLDPKVAVTYYHMGANAGDSEALYRLYEIFRNGKYNMVADSARALDYIRQGVDAGNVNAKYAMGLEFVKGELLGADREKGVSLIVEASDNGSSAASAWLGNQYYSGKDALARDYSKAYTYLRRVAENPGLIDLETLAEVYRNLSACYRFGRGTAQNADLAHTYALKSNNLGNDEMSTVVHFDDYLNAAPGFGE